MGKFDMSRQNALRLLDIKEVGNHEELKGENLINQEGNK